MKVLDMILGHFQKWSIKQVKMGGHKGLTLKVHYFKLNIEKWSNWLSLNHD